MRHSSLSQVSPRPREHGVSLIEMIAVIVILGVVAAIGGVGVSQSMESYRAAKERAELTEMADTALRRISRDVRSALPLSVRSGTGAGSTYLEMILTKNGGRYRTAGAGAITPGIETAGSFDILGIFTPGPHQTVQSGDIVVVNHQPTDAEREALQNNAYTHGASQPHCTLATSADCATSVLTGAPTESGIDPNIVTSVPIANRSFPTLAGLPPPVVYVLAPQPAVTYACITPGETDGTGTGRLVRYSSYPMQLLRQTSYIGANEARVVDNVSDCTMTVGTGAVADLVVIKLTIKRRGAETNLLHQIWLPNG